MFSTIFEVEGGGGVGFLTKNWTEEIKESGAVLDSGRETSKGTTL
jgi:hypothetical protein